jgi:uncharacterized cupredoxin-like copper-binding protein
MLKRKYIRLGFSLLIIAMSIIVFWAKDSFFASKDAAVSSDEMVIEIELKEWSITPEPIMIKKGDTIQMSIINRGSYPHDFVIPELDLKTKKLSPGDQESLTFIADHEVTIISYCSLPGHKESGMVAELSVK